MAILILTKHYTEKAEKYTYKKKENVCSDIPKNIMLYFIWYV